MTRLQHAHALVRHAAGHRIPGRAEPRRSAFRLTALATGLGLTAIMIVATSPGASAAGHAPAARSGADSHRASTSQKAPGPAHDPAPGPATGPASTGLLQHDARPEAVPIRKPAPGAEVPPRDFTPDMPATLRLDQRFAEDVLRGHGIGWRSTGRCSDRTVTTCTSFEGIRWGTIKGLIGFAESSGCEITVTGGTERGHASGAYSHWNGYKADIAPTSCVDRAIRRYPSSGVRGDGAKLYRSPDGALFAREKDHWDITFR